MGIQPVSHPNAARVADHARAGGVELEVIEYPAGTRTAGDAARAVGCAVDQIVKSMVFAAGSGLVLALTSGIHMVDPEALAIAAGVERCSRADADGVRAATGYPIGGVPPFGHSQPLPTLIDPHLQTFEIVWAAAGTPRHVFPIRPADLVRLSGARPAHFTTG